MDGVLIILDIISGLVIFSNKGRSAFAGLLLGLLLPVVMIIVAVSLSPYEGSPQARRGKKRCPRCKEWVQMDARVCRFCGFTKRPAAGR
jgi:hypothetical protein